MHTRFSCIKLPRIKLRYNRAGEYKWMPSYDNSRTTLVINIPISLNPHSYEVDSLDKLMNTRVWLYLNKGLICNTEYL